MTDRGHLRDELLARLLDGLYSKNWTQARLALEVGISQKHMSAVVTGRADGTLDLWDRLLTAVDR